MTLPTVTDLAIIIEVEAGVRHVPAYCAEHDCVASKWLPKNGGNCEYCIVVEQSCQCDLTPCALVPLPKGERMVAVVTEGGHAPASLVQAFRFITGTAEDRQRIADGVFDALVKQGERA